MAALVALSSTTRGTITQIAAIAAMSVNGSGRIRRQARLWRREDVGSGTLKEFASTGAASFDRRTSLAGSLAPKFRESTAPPTKLKRNAARQISINDVTQPLTADHCSRVQRVLLRIFGPFVFMRTGRSYRGPTWMLP